MVAVFNEVDALELHFVSALTALGLGPVALIQPRWQGGWSSLSILGGLVSFVALLLCVIPTFVGRSAAPSWIAAIYPGGSERLIVAPLDVWLISIGVRLIRTFRETSDRVGLPAATA